MFNWQSFYAMLTVSLTTAKNYEKLEKYRVKHTDEIKFLCSFVFHKKNNNNNNRGNMKFSLNVYNTVILLYIIKSLKFTISIYFVQFKLTAETIQQDEHLSNT